MNKFKIGDKVIYLTDLEEIEATVLDIQYPTERVIDCVGRERVVTFVNYKVENDYKIQFFQEEELLEKDSKSYFAAKLNKLERKINRVERKMNRGFFARILRIFR